VLPSATGSFSLTQSCACAQAAALQARSRSCCFRDVNFRQTLPAPSPQCRVGFMPARWHCRLDIAPVAFEISALLRRCGLLLCTVESYPCPRLGITGSKAHLLLSRRRFAFHAAGSFSRTQIWVCQLRRLKIAPVAFETSAFLICCPLLLCNTESGSRARIAVAHWKLHMLFLKCSQGRARVGTLSATQSRVRARASPPLTRSRACCF